MKYLQLTSIACLFAFSFTVNAQAPLWTFSINSLPDSANILPVRTLIDNSGDVLVLCTYRKVVQNSTVFKIVLEKIDFSGNEKWKLEFDNNGTGDPRGFDLAVDAQNTIYVAGGLMSSPSFTPFLLAISPNGIPIWQRDTTQAFSTGNYMQMVFQNNKIYLAGTSGIVVYASNGTELWSNNIVPSRIAVDKNGELIASSYQTSSSIMRFDMFGNLNFSDSSIVAERIAIDDERNIYLLSQLPFYSLVKLDSSGTFQWKQDAFPATPPFGDLSFDILFDLNKDLILTGLNDTMFKYSPSGQLIWRKSMHGLDQYRNIPVISQSNLLFIAGITIGPQGNDILIKSFNSQGNPNWSVIYSSNNLQEFAVDMTIDGNGIYILEDSIGNSNLLKFENPVFHSVIDFNDLCIDSIWYDTLSAGIINVKVYNAGIGQFNYPSLQIISPAGDTISNIYNLVNFFAHLPNDYQIYSDTITISGITDFTNYRFVMYEGFGASNGEITFCSTLSINKNALRNIKLYPTPTQNQFTVNGLNSSEAYKVEIIDIHGRVTNRVNLNGVEFYTGNATELINGLYFLRVIGKEKTIVLHLLIQK